MSTARGQRAGYGAHHRNGGHRRPPSSARGARRLSRPAARARARAASHRLGPLRAGRERRRQDRCTSSSTTTGSGSRSRASRTSPPTAARCSCPTTSGVMPSDGAMIAKAVREEHPRPRPLHIATASPFPGLPGVGMLVTKLGAVGAHPANLHRLLFDEDQLVLVFPEGNRGTAQAAARALPAAEVRPDPVRRDGAPRPGTDRPRRGARRRGGAAHVRLARTAAAAGTSPADDWPTAAGEVPDPVPRAGRDRPAGRVNVARSRGRWRAAVRYPGTDPGEPPRDGRLSAERVARLAAAAAERSPQSTMPRSRRILITGLSSLWGGRLAQRLERDGSVEAIVGVDTTDPRHQLERTEFVRVDTDDVLLRRIVRAAAIDTVVDTRLIPIRSSRASATRTRSTSTGRGASSPPARAPTAPYVSSCSSPQRSTTARRPAIPPSSPRR